MYIYIYIYYVSSNTFCWENTLPLFTYGYLVDQLIDYTEYDTIYIPGNDIECIMNEVNIYDDWCRDMFDTSYYRV